jgi:hypothetical protein
MPRHLPNSAPSIPPPDDESAFAMPAGDEQLTNDQDFGFRFVIEPDLAYNPVVQDQFGDLATRESWHRTESIPETFSVVGENFEMTMDDSLRQAITERGFGRTRKEFLELISTILADPHGETSIDTFKDTDAGRMARLVHEVEGPLSDILPGKKLAIKGTGLDMEGTRSYLELNGSHRSQLTQQFRDTLLLSRAQKQVAPNGIGDLVSINEVYGVIRWQDPDTKKIQEWMLMEYVEGAEPVTNISIALSRGGTVPGFRREHDPELAALADGPYPSVYSHKLVRFSELGDHLAEKLGLITYGKHELSDLNGNNVLRQETADGPRYTIIDIG